MSIDKDHYRSKIDKYKEEIKDYIENDKTGSQLFHGKTITWRRLGLNYFKSWYDKNYEKAVIEVFAEKMQSEVKIEAQSALYGLVDKGETERHLKRIMLMPESDISKAKKMEFVLTIIGDITELQKIGAERKEGTFFKEAQDFFNTEKEKTIKKTIDQISKCEGKQAIDLKILEKLHNIGTAMPVGSEKNLKDFQKSYARAVVKEVVKGFDDKSTNNLFVNIMSFPEEDIPRLNKMELILIAAKEDKKWEENEFITEARDYFDDQKQESINILKKISKLSGELATLENIAILDSIHKNAINDKSLIKSEDKLREFQTKYAESIKNAMVKMCDKDPILLTNLKRSFKTLTTQEPSIIISKNLAGSIEPPTITREKAIEIIGARRGKADALSAISGVILTDELLNIEILRGAKNQKTLDAISEKYIKRKVNNKTELDVLKMAYIKELIFEIIKITKNDKKVVEVLDKNINKIVDDKKLNLSRNQKTQIRNLLNENVNENVNLNLIITEIEAALRKVKGYSRISITEIKTSILNFKFLNKILIKTRDRIIDSIITKEYSSFDDNEKAAIKQTILTEIFNKEKTLVMNELGLSIQQQNEFLKKYPRFESISTSAVFEDFIDIIHPKEKQIPKIEVRHKPSGIRAEQSVEKLEAASTTYKKTSEALRKEKLDYIEVIIAENIKQNPRLKNLTLADKLTFLGKEDIRKMAFDVKFKEEVSKWLSTQFK